MLIRTGWFRLSRRGAFLTLTGVAFILLGYSYLTIPTAAKPLLRAYFRFALELFPFQVYGWAWIVCGTLAVIGGVVHRLDALGFAAAVFMPTVWCVLYAVAQVEDGVPRAWVNACVFGLLAAMIGLVAGIADPLDGAPGRPPWWRQ